jgi:hypothetical protein
VAGIFWLKSLFGRRLFFDIICLGSKHRVKDGSDARIAFFCDGLSVVPEKKST